LSGVIIIEREVGNTAGDGEGLGPAGRRAAVVADGDSTAVAAATTTTTTTIVPTPSVPD
jgi:hypothetical protein